MYIHRLGEQSEINTAVAVLNSYLYVFYSVFQRRFSRKSITNNCVYDMYKVLSNDIF